jgi:tetratricopeptide (TPR) repeat protein
VLAAALIQAALNPDSGHEEGHVGMRFRKSIRLGPGVRVNVSKRGVGLGVGPQGMSYSVNSSGRTYKSVGVPGTGLSYVQTGTVGSGRRPSSQSPPQAPPTMPKPGMLAPKHEKAFHRALEHYFAGQPQEALAQFRQASALDSGEQALSDDFFAGLVAMQLGDDSGAIPYFEKVVASPSGLPDALMLRYVAGGGFTITVTPAVAIQAGFDSLGAVLALAECYQSAGRKEEAIGLLQQLVELDREPALVLSLCELYYLTSSWDDIIELAAGTENKDDATLQIMVYLARAFWQTGKKESALEVYRAALRSTKRNADLLKEARYCRGALYYDLGQKGRAKADFARLYAMDPNYESVGAWLDACERPAAEG